MEKVAVFSVIFEANLQFLNTYLTSLASQTFTKFDVVLMVDDVPNIEVLISPFRPRLKIVTYPVQGSIASVRKQGFARLCSQGYEFIVFSDTDDLFSNERVEVCVNYLRSHAIVVNDLIPFGCQLIRCDGYWSGRLATDFIFDANQITRFNFAGLGNSAVRIDVLKTSIAWSDVRALDWYLFYQWLKSFKGVFVHDGPVLYRQHDNNMVGINRVTDKRIQQIADIKTEHYRSLAQWYPELKASAAASMALKHRLDEDYLFLQRSTELINKTPTNYFWWEETEYLS